MRAAAAARQKSAMTFGEELRRERELRQISLREIATATKIDVRRLEALERNDFSGLPGGLYNRGYVRAYCKHLGLDADAMINAYLLEERAQASPTPDGGKLLRGRPSGAPPFPAAPAPAPRPWRGRLAVAALVGVALLAVTLLLWWAFGGAAFSTLGDARHAPDASSSERPT
jgi:transcriptional regulator with XRE-family HTH domain